MAQKEGGKAQMRVKTGEHLGAKAIAGAPIAGGGVVVEVREKKGPLRAAIPTMPFPLAVICLFLNTFLPGLDDSCRVSIHE
ncbi:Protein stum [Liparis tanakae]|uniref:Protein stum n=1 Tax=Liparis tanakae TaxID=230148 RepID=A0A4Z2FBN9_9TELE|nr:Protein stum [Liparis tanakae]